MSKKNVEGLLDTLEADIFCFQGQLSPHSPLTSRAQNAARTAGQGHGVPWTLRWVLDLSPSQVWVLWRVYLRQLRLLRPAEGRRGDHWDIAWKQGRNDETAMDA